KPTAILVNLTDPLILPSSQVITVRITFEGAVYTNFTTGTKILGDSIVSIWDQSIIPPNTPKPAAANDKITGYYQIDDGAEKSLEDTYITVKDTSGLSLTYLNLTRSNYGTESSVAYNQMAESTTAFMNAVYPTKITDVRAGTTISGAPKATTAQAKKDPYYALKIDCVTAAAARYLGGGVGVAIGPNASGSMDYFTYHGFPGAAGFTANPSTRGVIVLDSYYTATAHEVGHIYGLNWGAGNEEYNTNPNKIGNTASGVWAANGQWIKGYNFMGLAEYGKVQSTWVNQSTYQNLFNLMKTTSDPEILLANGLIYENGTVEFLQTWYHLPQGTPDTLIPGDYALRFVNATGYVLSTTSFDASFFVQIDPGVGVGQNEIDLSDFGAKETDSATFAFAAEYPAGTSAVQVVNMTEPDAPVVMATVKAADIVNYFNGFLPPINNDDSSIFKLGSTVPVKFQLRDIQGNFISTAIANISVAKITDHTIGTEVEAVSTSAATTGNLFRYDPTSKQYIFNLSTKSLSKGTWQIKVVINDGTTRTVKISLK
ncbi:PxKF domain-containing protein, partial [Candidatus Bathyarchaeota archaeon]|nr:PxKF domain-containing protein [Candidatus Bathyarchaeota archaeon]